MATFYIEGYGRQRGAIGCFHSFSDQVEAESIEDARLKLYDRWEHIRIERWRKES